MVIDQVRINWQYDVILRVLKEKHNGICNSKNQLVISVMHIHPIAYKTVKHRLSELEEQGKIEILSHKTKKLQIIKLTEKSI